MGIIRTVEEKLGIKKSMADPQQGQPIMVTEEVAQDAPQAPVSAAPADVPQAPAAPAAPAKKQNLPDPAPEEDTTTPKEEDRSAYNCIDCAGEGLLDPYTRCPRCQGTGKV